MVFAAAITYHILHEQQLPEGDILISQVCAPKKSIFPFFLSAKVPIGSLRRYPLFSLIFSSRRVADKN
jgi:hypothetical protein